jgi:hypothetical protein
MSDQLDAVIHLDKTSARQPLEKTAAEMMASRPKHIP